MKSGLKKLVGFLGHMKDSADMAKALSMVFTPQEIAAATKRIDIIDMLLKNVPQKKIAEKLGVGIATVERGAHGLRVNTWWKDFKSWRAKV